MQKRLLVGTRKGLFTFVDDGKPGAPRWRIADKRFIGVPVPMVMHDRRDGALYAALDHGHFGNKLHASRDGGATWEEVGVPAYPAQDDKDEAVSLKLVWSLAAGGEAEPGRLWCGTLPGGLFTSTDSGATWRLVESLWNSDGRKKWFGGGADHPGIHSICVDPRDHRRLVLGVSCGGVQVSEDSGATWRVSSEGMRADYMPPDRRHDPDVQDPHCIVQCAASPAHFWCQHHNGIWRSTDDAAHWEEVTDVEPSTFGFAVAVHPEDPDTAWLVPAQKDEARYPVDGQVVVNRTRDGGRSFETLREGLPQDDAYDLTFRHALDIDDGGDRLAFGSTTGNLWFTADQGDSWQVLSHHLPPVYVVRFA
ncbi:MAG: exo-alpha-sialidase [Planctomycetota bacterium]